MSDPLSHWRKALAAGGKPAYLLIADLIAQDIDSGRLGPRDRLVTLRELSDQLQINYTTAARGYAEARKRGLIDARVGSGSFVRVSRAPTLLRSGAEMSMNLPPEPAAAELQQRLRDGATSLLAQVHWHDLLRYQDFGGTAHERHTAATWLCQRLPTCHADQVLLAPGIHSVLGALMSELARPGGVVCVEALTYPGLKALANQLGVRLHALPMDEDGLLVDAFEDACKSLKPQALVCNPTLHNPTTATLPQARREALADVALRYSVPLIEDDAYAMLPRQSPPTLASLAPDITHYVSGFSKCFGAGLRTAYVRAPSARLAQRLAGALRASSVMASPITSALATRWVLDGTVEAMRQAIRQASQARQALAERHLAAHAYRAHPDGFHLWLPLPRGTPAAECAAHLRAQGVGAVASAAFSTSSQPPEALRLCLGGPGNLAQCEQALRLVAHTLEHPLRTHTAAL